MVDVFISYPRAERARVEPILDKLEALQLDVFFDLKGIDGGAVFPNVIDRALKASKAVLCAWSPMYFTRSWCLVECRFAHNRGLLTPVRLEAFDQDAPPADLMGVNFYDLADWSGEDAHEDWNRTLRSLGQKLGRELAPELSRGVLGGLKAGPAPAPSAPAAAKADLLEDLRRTWAAFPARDDSAAVAKYLERVRAAAPGSGVEFEIEHHLDGLEHQAAEARAAAERAAEDAQRADEEVRRAEDDARRREARLAAIPAGTVFRDALAGGGEGPEMVVIPAGRFTMGSPPDEPGRRDNEGPQHEVTFARPFALGRYPVTFDEFDLFCIAVGRSKHGDEGWGRGRRPAIYVSWNEATAYCTWLSEQTGVGYRLPSEAEWEYACRAGSTTPFWWGREITPDQANYTGRAVYAGGGAKGVDRHKTVPVDAFDPNPWGLYQTHGNVWEWCGDAWNDGYCGAPQDGSAWMSGDTSLAVLPGGTWLAPPPNLRSASRAGNPRGNRSYSVGGFRLARTLVE